MIMKNYKKKCFYARNFEKVRAYWFWPVTIVSPFKTILSYSYGFLIKKVADPYFFCLNYLPPWCYAPFKGLE